LTTSRNFHTCTLLNNSNILICGGENNGGYVSSCEVFNVCFGFGTTGSPLFGCINTNVQLSAQTQPLINGVGSWSSTPAVVFSDATNLQATFSTTTASNITFQWSSPFCSASVNITAISPPTAQFPSSNITIPAGTSCAPYPLQVNPLGDTIGGSWTVPNGSVNPSTGLVTFFSWNASQIGTTFNISFTPQSVCTTPVILTVNLTNGTCVNCAGFIVTVPLYGCINSAVPVSATFDSPSGAGQWSSVNSSVVFANMSQNSEFTSSANGMVTIVWASVNCKVSRTVTIISPPIAVIPVLPQQLCGPFGSANVGARLFGDAIAGKWTVTPTMSGSFDNVIPAFTLFSWTQSGNVILQFTPDSVCNAPASLTIEIDPSCPQVLSREATIGIAVGATLGGLILIATGVLAAIWLYRVWNRRLVQFRKNDDVGMASSQYKF
jgi:hypothetical protein